MKVLKDENLKNYSFLKIGGTAKFIVEIESENDITDFIAFTNKEKIPFIVLGSGSNTFFGDGYLKKAFGLIKIIGRYKSYEGPDFVNIEIGAGEDWDEIVDWTVENNWMGLECLSLIPGTIGASPVQNIGAYGQEVKNVITHVRAYDTEYDEFVEIPSDQCLFEYRNSIFKKNPGRFIISSVSFQLKKQKENIPIPQYKDLQLYFLSKKQKSASLAEIREAVINIRKDKLPDPKENPNCGSFFKNAIINKDLLEKILKEFPQMPSFKISDNEYKIYSGWLIEKVNLKGFEYKNLMIDKNNALIVLNKGESKSNDVLDLEKIIKEKVKNTFGIELEREPIFIN